MGEEMEPAVNSDVRQLCKAVAEEEDNDRINVLLDQLVQALDDRELAAALL